MTIALFVIIPVLFSEAFSKKWSQTPRQSFAAVANQCLRLQNAMCTTTFNKKTQVSLRDVNLEQNNLYDCENPLVFLC